MAEDPTSAPPAPLQLAEDQKRQVLAQIATEPLPCGGRAWAGAVNSGGQGYFEIDGEPRSAVQLVRFIETGERLAKGKRLYVTCGDKLCLDHRSTKRPGKAKDAPPAPPPAPPSDVRLTAESPATAQPEDSYRETYNGIVAARFETKAASRSKGSSTGDVPDLPDPAPDDHLTFTTSDVGGVGGLRPPKTSARRTSGSSGANVRRVREALDRVGERGRRRARVVAVLVGLAISGYLHTKAIGLTAIDLMPRMEVQHQGPTTTTASTTPPIPPTTTAPTTTIPETTTTTGSGPRPMGVPDVPDWAPGARR